ncbi:hypothetical protein HII36_33000, partial [Nonomuraea sp. NN258]|nr:hypothetical protein [Nonomuraea antri]
MHRPPHGFERAVEVYSGHDDVVGVTGSGYVVGPDLVLTSELVAGPDAPCQVRPPWSPAWSPAEPVWRGMGAVLLRVAFAPWRTAPGVEHVRWGRVAGDRLRCVARGFAKSPQRAGFRDVETLTGLVDAATGAVAKSLAVDVLSPEPVSMPTSLWLGMSGSALLAEPSGQVLGVIAASRAGYADRRLDALPIAALLADERFRALVGVQPGQVEPVAESDRAVLLPALLRPARTEPPAERPDWTLLVPRHAAVPFLGRAGQLAELRAWAVEPDPFSIAVLAGQPGIGKTRLAAELCEELRETGWDTGFLPLDALGAPLSEPHARLDALRPTLLVAERPEPSPALVGELVRRLARHERNPRVRLLLVARGEGDWWRRLDTASGGWLRRLTSTSVQLNSHPLTLQERREHALAAMTAFAPSRAALPEPPTLDDPEYGLPLRVHLAALLRLRGDELGPDPISRFLAREQEQWARVWPAFQERLDEVTARQAVALRTLTAPSPVELRGLLTAVPGLRDAARLGRRMAVADWLGRVFPGDGLAPDLVAARLLDETEDLAALVLAVHDHPGRTTAHLVNLIDMLLRAGSPAALRTLVTSRIDRLVEEAAAAPATRLGDLIAAAVAAFPESVSALPSAYPADGRLGLRTLEVLLGELAVARLRAGGRRLPLAGALSGLSTRLAAVGRVGEAVVVAAESVDIFAAAPPYEEAAAHAEALFNLAACLLRAGEADAAIKPATEAAARFRILAEDDPRHAGRAGQAHYNLACALVETGRLAEAAQAFRAAGGDSRFATGLTGVLSAAPKPPPDPSPGPLPRPLSGPLSGPLSVSPTGPLSSPLSVPPAGPPEPAGVTLQAAPVVLPAEDTRAT